MAGDDALALQPNDTSATENRDPGKEMGPIESFGFGALVSVTGLPFAIPYIAALDRILRVDLTSFEASMVLVEAK